MEVDIFKEIIVPVIGGLGVFMLGLEFMANGIQALSVNKMREWLGRMAGTPAKGVLAGTLITGIIQSSTAMTVMTVGLVNAGVIALRPAISVIMGANIGTTLGNGLIALPLGPLGLLFGGIFGLVYVFGKTDRVRNIALACLGFALIFYGLNLMTGGLKPLKDMPEVMAILSSLDASTFPGVIACALIAALITAMIHSSSATIGIVMGLGASGVLPWQTAIAFAIGADLGTTITSWMASLNLTKNAKRAAYAHIAFNFIGVAVVLLLFFPAIEVLKWVMGFFGGDPGVAVMVDGKETFPLVPVAVGMFSIAFNIFNVLILYPFIGTFEQVLSRIGHSSEEDIEDYSVPRYLDRKLIDSFVSAVPAVEQETRRQLQAAALFLDIARGKPGVPKDPGEHHMATDLLGRDIRNYSAALFHEDMPRDQLDLVASLIEEVDFTGSLSETLHQIARRVTERLRGGVLRSERGWTETPLFAHPPQQADARVVEALRKCRDQFDWYVTLHLGKTPPDTAKGKANQDFRDLCDEALSRAQAPASQPAQEMVERLARTLGDTELDFLGEPLRMNATREDLERLACAILTALPQAQAAADEKLAIARDCLLNLIADAKRFDEDVDGDEVNGSQVVYVDYHITTDESQLRELAESLGIKPRWQESIGDALLREIEEDSATLRTEKEG